MLYRKKKLTLEQRHNLMGWLLLVPASALIICMIFYPMTQALALSLKSGAGTKMDWVGFSNYTRILKDKTFFATLGHTVLYLIIQVPVMLLLALILASVLNSSNLRFRWLFRVAIFLPCATSLVAYSMIFRALFTSDGFINSVLSGLGLPVIKWFAGSWTARFVIIAAMIWRWTGFNMIFYQSALQNIDYSVYEAARIDGASSFQTLLKITIPLLKPTILVTAIMSTNGTLQLFDESVNLTSGGPGISTMTMSHYIYNTSFVMSPNMGYASAMAMIVMVMIAILALMQMKVGDKRD